MTMNIRESFWQYIFDWQYCSKGQLFFQLRSAVISLSTNTVLRHLNHSCKHILLFHMYHYIILFYTHLGSGLVTTVSVIVSGPVICCYANVPLVPSALSADVRDSWRGHSWSRKENDAIKKGCSSVECAALERVCIETETPSLTMNIHLSIYYARFSPAGAHNMNMCTRNIFQSGWDRGSSIMRKAKKCFKK